MSLIIKIYGSKNQLVEVRTVSLTIISSDLLTKFLLPFPILCSAGLEFLGAEWGKFIPSNTAMMPLNWKLPLCPVHFDLLMLLREQTKAGVTVL